MIMIIIIIIIIITTTTTTTIIIIIIIKYAEELDLDLKLSELNPTNRTADGNEVSGKQIGVWAKGAQQQQLRQEITKEKWQGKLLKIRWEDDQLSRSCFDWLKEWKTGPSNTITAVQELYQQLPPTKLDQHKKTGINTSPDVLCRMCGKCPESVPHILSGCSTLAQTKYLARHNSALKILFLEIRTWYPRYHHGTRLSNLNQRTRMKELRLSGMYQFMQRV